MSSRAWRADRVQASFLARDGKITLVLEKIGFSVKAFKISFRRLNFSWPPQRKIINGPSTGSLGILRRRDEDISLRTMLLVVRDGM